MVFVDQDPKKGRILRSSQAYAPGELILEEAAFVSIPASQVRNNKKLQDLCFERGLSSTLLHAALLLMKQPEIHEQILNLYCPPQAGRLQGLVEATPSILAQLATPTPAKKPKKQSPASNETDYKSIDSSLLVKLMLILDANCIEGHEQSLDLYPTVSMMSHACDNNCSVSIPAPGGRIQLRALQPIQPQDELCISYLSSEQLLEPCSDRQHMLLVGKQFLCTCSRCLGPDWCRSFLCPRCHHPSLPLNPDDLLFCRHPSCGQLLLSKEKTAVLSAEKSLLQAYALLDEMVTRCSDPVSNIQKLLNRAKAVLAPCHFVIRGLWCMLRDYYEQVENHAQAAEAGAHVLDGVQRLEKAYRGELFTEEEETDQEQNPASSSSSSSSSEGEAERGLSVEERKEEVRQSGLQMLDRLSTIGSARFALAVLLERQGDNLKSARQIEAARACYVQTEEIYRLMNGAEHALVAAVQKKLSEL